MEKPNPKFAWKQELRDKYPQLLGETKSMDCGKGWRWLIDVLCEQIQQYIESGDFMKQYTQVDFNFGSPPNFLDGGVRYIPKEPEKVPKVYISYIKEKFGILDVMVKNADSTIWNYVSFAARISTKTCEDCGSTKYMGKTSGWIRHLCKDCGEKDRNPWIAFKDYTKEIRAEKLENIEENKDEKT